MERQLGILLPDPGHPDELKRARNREDFPMEMEILSRSSLDLDSGY